MLVLRCVGYSGGGAAAAAEGVVVVDGRPHDDEATTTSSSERSGSAATLLQRLSASLQHTTSSHVVVLDDVPLSALRDLRLSHVRLMPLNLTLCSGVARNVHWGAPFPLRHFSPPCRTLRSRTRVYFITSLASCNYRRVANIRISAHFTHLRKFRNFVFATEMTIFSDHNP